MKKKINIRYDNEAGEDMQYYLQQFKKEAMKKAEEIFGEPESSATDVPTKPDAEIFDMKDMYKTSRSKAKPKQEKAPVETNLTAVLAKIKKEAQKRAADIFKTE